GQPWRYGADGYEGVGEDGVGMDGPQAGGGFSGSDSAVRLPCGPVEGTHGSWQHLATQMVSHSCKAPKRGASPHGSGGRPTHAVAGKRHLVHSAAPDPPDSLPTSDLHDAGAGGELSRAEQSWQTLVQHVAPAPAAGGGGLSCPYPNWQTMADSLAERAASSEVRGGLFSPYPNWQNLAEKAQAHSAFEPALYPVWEYLTERMVGLGPVNLPDQPFSDGEVATGLSLLGFGGDGGLGSLAGSQGEDFPGIGPPRETLEPLAGGEEGGVLLEDETRMDLGGGVEGEGNP
ncbi:hypothetical protein T484DRAFT_1851532, partial [Baffinella frigidus]